jgi:pimeloyl-ACP methyl ester carboxylesterase
MWQSQFIESNGIQLHYTRTGGDKPALILLHGFSDDGLCWTPIAQHLEGEYDILMLDARGHGRSDAPESGYGHDQHAADVAGVIHGLHLSKPMVMGHSMGAVTTLALAGLYPDLPGAIVLEDPPPFWEQRAAGLQTERRKGMGSWIIDLKRKTREEMIEGNRQANPTWSEAEHGPWADSKLRLSLYVMNGFGGAGLDMREAVQRITCPALLITADTTLGAITNAQQAADLKALVPQLRVVNIARAGHSIRREQLEPYLQCATDFLHEVKG